MDFLTLPTLLISICAVIFAGVSKAGFGSGVAFVSGAVMAVILPPAQALGVMLPLLMLIDATTLRPYWNRWDLRDCGFVILGAVPGIALGALVYQLTNDDMLRVLIGAVALLFVLWQGGRALGLIRVPPRALGPKAAVLTGSVTGFTSFVSHAGGPPVAIYMLSKGLDKTTYQANSVLIFWAINLMKAVPYGVLGIFTLTTLTFDLILAPFALMGTWIGVKAHAWVPERLFFALTYIALIGAGGKLLWDGLA